MTTANIISSFSSPKSNDFVRTDEADLASHMETCASSRGRFFALQTALQFVHSIVSVRIITVAAVVVAGAGLLVLA